MRRWILVLMLALAACGSPEATSTPDTTAPDPTEEVPVEALEIKEIQIDSVNVVVAESMPPQVRVEVTGVLGNGCSELNDVTQQRAGNEITVTITSKQPKDAICTMEAKLYQETITLDGEFTSGAYVVRVNGMEAGFDI